MNLRKAGRETNSHLYITLKFQKGDTSIHSGKDKFNKWNLDTWVKFGNKFQMY